MDFAWSEEQRSIRDSVERTCSRFDEAYWYNLDQTGEFPTDFYGAMADAGWLGIAMPEEVGGAGLGVKEAAILMHTVARSGGGMSAASSIHINIFGPHPIVVFGTDEQKQRWLPDLIQGRAKTCFGVTEPDAGLNTLNLTLKAQKTSNGYELKGKKIWTSTAQVADKIMVLARTTPKEECKRATDGLSLFYTDLNRDYVSVRRIPKMGRAAVDSNELFFDGLIVPPEDLIGEEGKGFQYLLHSLNPERILVGVEAIGVGQDALARAARYAGDRVVFDRPIGQNQGIQHPLAACWAELEAALLMCLQAADLYDRGEPCGHFANAGKYLGAEAGYKACTQAVMTHGGMGYAKEFHVERLLREAMIPRLAPVSQQLILCNIAEKVLGLPKSY